jgi:Ca-activated chloride channel family protein
MPNLRIFFLVIFAVLLSASSLNDARKANDAFNSGDYEKAAELYRQAIAETPDDPRLHFNLGSALAKMGEAEAAVQAFQSAKELMDNPEDKARADYNAGTVLSNAEMYDEALDFYKNAMRNDPGDADAKHNYEMSLKKQQEQEQEQQQQDQNSNDEQQENQDQDQNQNQDQDQQQNQDQQNQNQDQSQDQQQDQNEGSPEDQQAGEQSMPQPNEISREEAENILNALEQLERQILENRKKEAADPESSNDKDW